MRETTTDLEQLQRLLDESHRAGGSHLRSIITDERRLSAEQLAATLTGMRLLVVATATADGRPLTGAVDGFFYRGRFWFGSAETSVRFRHLRRRPHISATHLPGEQLQVTVHGRAVFVDLAAEPGFVEVCREYYGDAWDEWDMAGHPYVRIDADRMYTFSFEP